MCEHARSTGSHLKVYSWPWQTAVCHYWVAWLLWVVLHSPSMAGRVPDAGWSYHHPSHACRDSAEAAERGRSKAVSQLSLVQDEVSRLKSELANEQARCTKLRAEVSTTSVGHVKVQWPDWWCMHVLCHRVVSHSESWWYAELTRAVPACCVGGACTCCAAMLCFIPSLGGKQSLQGQSLPSMKPHDAPTASPSLACTACRRF